MDVDIGQNLFSIFNFWRTQKRSVRFAVLYQSLLDKAVYATIKFCLMACCCLGKAMLNWVMDIHLVSKYIMNRIVS